MYEEPLLQVIFDALVERGWEMRDDPDRQKTLFVDPEGNEWDSVETAIRAQTFREIAQA